MKSTEPVVVLEFTGLASEMSFEAAFPRESGAAVVRIDPLAGVSGSGPVDLARHARAVAGELLVSGGCRALVANCNGSPFAVHLAAALAGEGSAPRAAILVDPIATTYSDLREVLATLLAGLGGGTDPAGGGSLALPWPEDPVKLHATLMRGLHEAAQAHLKSVLEEDEDLDLVAESLVGRYASWIALLIGNTSAPRPMLDIPLHVLHSHGRDDLPRLVDARGPVSAPAVPDAAQGSDSPLAHPQLAMLLRELAGCGGLVG